MVRRARAASPPAGAPAKGDAYESAVRYLANRPRSVAEIERHLRSRRFDAAAIEHATDALRAQRYVDDEAFARYWVEQRARFRPRGDRALRAELLQRGVARDTIALVLGEADPEDEVRRARDAIRRPITRWLTLEAAERKRKIHAYLAQRGFDYDTIEAVVARAEDDET